MDDRQLAPEPMPLWGIVLTLLAVAMLVGVVVRIVVDYPGSADTARSAAPPAAVVTTLAAR